MDMAVDILTQIDDDVFLATDGSVEGMLTIMQHRNDRPSLFLRDEFSGFIEQSTRREYQAGMLETLTKLYDGKLQKRVLRRETITISSPRLVVYAGGIRSRVLQLLSYDHISSGFLPRFVFITAESDVSKLRPIGPPTPETYTERLALTERFRQIYDHYVVPVSRANGKLQIPKVWDATLTPDAWVRYNMYESMMAEAGLTSNQPEIMVPTFDRLSKSGLKAAILLAATRMEDKLVITEQDMLRAFYYVEQWRAHVIDIVRNIGKTAGERQMEKVLDYVQQRPGCLRSTIMQVFRLTARDADVIFTTLEQRGQIYRTSGDRGAQILRPTDVTV
jgi:hypothetical protein